MQAEKEGKAEKYLAQGMKREIRLFSKKGREMGTSDLQIEKRKTGGQNAHFLKERQVKRKMFHLKKRKKEAGRMRKGTV